MRSHPRGFASPEWLKAGGEIQENFSANRRPAYTTVQTMVYRLEEKKALRRTRKIGAAHIFEATISRDAARRRMNDDWSSIYFDMTLSADGRRLVGQCRTAQKLWDCQLSRHQN